MEFKRNILLPKSAFALADDEDTYIMLQLNRTVSDIKNEKINNIFNFNKQYELERQNSLKFCIFGLVDSHFIDTQNIIIDVKESNDLTLSLPKIANDCITGKTFSTKTFELTEKSGMSRNVYGKNKSSYSFLFEINKTELNADDARIIQNGGIPQTRTINFIITDEDRKVYFSNNVPYLFYDLDGNRVKFGNQTADVDDSGNIIEINNDFPFLYDRHWIKQYFDLPTPSYVLFPELSISTSENIPIEKQISVGLSAGTIYFNVALDQPSPYGLEEADVVVNVDNTVKNPNLDYVFIPTTVKWNRGEQIKNVAIDIVDDNYVENNESVSFKLINLKSCLLGDLSASTFTLTILDNDIPCKIKFPNNNITVKNNVSFVTIEYVFDKPLAVPNQTIELYYTSNTNAVLGTDFIFDTNNPTATSKKITFNEGDISGSTTINIIEKDGYDLDRLLEIGFRNPTQNIAISNTGIIQNVGQVSRVTIKDTTITQYSSFVLNNNGSKKIGTVESFRSPKVGYYGGIYSNNYKWNNDFENGFLPNANYKLSIVNDGDTVVYNNELITKNSILTAVTVTTIQDSDIILKLPSNILYDKPNKRYKKSKYTFNIESNDKFLAEQRTFGNENLSIQLDYLPVNISTEKDAGLSDDKKYYLTTKLKNFIFNYNNSLSACSLDNTFDKVGVAYTNNLVFIGYPQQHNDISTSPNDSATETTFESTKTAIQCSQFMPFGFGQLPSPPYKFNYIELNMRNIYPQSSQAIPDTFNSLKLEYIDSQAGGFLRWANTSDNVKNSMLLSILNNGDVEVKISGKTINPGEKFYVSGLDVDLETFSIVLPTNESFHQTTSTFLIANYILALENVSYFSLYGFQPVGNPISFKFDSTNTLVSGPSNAIPKYNIVSVYKDMYVPVINNFNNNAFDNNNAQIDCASSNFHTNVKLINLAVKGVLLSNSKSSFVRGYFIDANNDIGYTCESDNSNRIPFEQIRTI